jgi:hypothetical protein
MGDCRSRLVEWLVKKNLERHQKQPRQRLLAAPVEISFKLEVIWQAVADGVLVQRQKNLHARIKSPRS